MKVGYIHDSEMPGPEASTVNVAKMCAGFVSNGHSALLLHLRGRGGGTLRDHYALQHDIKHLGFPIPPALGIRKKLFSLAAAISVRAFNPDLVYGRKPIQLLPAMKLGLPVILELHSPLGTDQSASRAAFSKMLKSDDLLRVVTISQALADDIAAEWPAAEGRIVVAHDGADPMAAPVEPVPRPNAGRPCVGYAGHLYPGKGMEIIAALARLRPEVDFVVLGGRPEDLAHWKNATAHQRNLYFCGMVPHSRVPAHLADCDVVLAPYASRVQVSDGATDVARWMSPLKIFEYMAQARAIMASRLPVIEEILQDGETAALCPPGEPEAWAARLDSLLADPEKRRLMSERARVVLESQYSWKRRAELVLAGVGEC